MTAGQRLATGAEVLTINGGQDADDKVKSGNSESEVEAAAVPHNGGQDGDDDMAKSGVGAAAVLMF